MGVLDEGGRRRESSILALNGVAYNVTSQLHALAAVSSCMSWSPVVLFVNAAVD